MRVNNAGGKINVTEDDLTIATITITTYFIHPSGKLKLSFDRTTKKISQ